MPMQFGPTICIPDSFAMSTICFCSSMPMSSRVSAKPAVYIAIPATFRSIAPCTIRGTICRGTAQISMSVPLSAQRVSPSAVLQSVLRGQHDARVHAQRAVGIGEHRVQVDLLYLGMRGRELRDLHDEALERLEVRADAPTHAFQYWEA